MTWISRLLRRRPRAGPEYEDTLAAYLAAPRPEGRTPTGTLRIVVVDVETSGLDPRRDRLLAIGAVGVRDGVISFGDGFEVVLRQEQVSDNDNILVHRIDGTTQRSGSEPADALSGLLKFVAGGPLAGFNADFDRIAIDRALDSAFGLHADNRWLDVASLAPAVFPEHADAARTLDDWSRIFGIENPARHNAVADALVTAQLLLISMARAAQTGAHRLDDLVALSKAYRWLAR